MRQLNPTPQPIQGPEYRTKFELQNEKMGLRNNTTVFIWATYSGGELMRTHNAAGETTEAWLGTVGSTGATRVAIRPRGHKYVPTAEREAAINKANNRPIGSYMGAA